MCPWCSDALLMFLFSDSPAPFYVSTSELLAVSAANTTPRCAGSTTFARLEPNVIATCQSVFPDRVLHPTASRPGPFRRPRRAWRRAARPSSTSPRSLKPDHHANRRLIASVDVWRALELALSSSEMPRVSQEVGSQSPPGAEAVEIGELQRVERTERVECWCQSAGG